MEPSANVILSGTETIYREELVNANYDGQNYKLNIRAQDMPRGGSGNLAQERIQSLSGAPGPKWAILQLDDLFKSGRSEINLKSL